MCITRQVALVALGAILIVVFVIIWKHATDAMTLFLENSWCTTVDQKEVCRLRGYQHFLVWTVIGIVNLLVVGFLLDCVAGRFRH